MFCIYKITGCFSRNYTSWIKSNNWWIGFFCLIHRYPIMQYFWIPWHTQPMIAHTYTISTEYWVFHSTIALWECILYIFCYYREGHEMLTLYYTIRARYLSHEEITQFAYHIQRCNNKQISSHINASLSNRYVNFCSISFWTHSQKVICI